MIIEFESPIKEPKTKYIIPAKGNVARPPKPHVIRNQKNVNIDTQYIAQYINVIIITTCINQVHAHEHIIAIDECNLLLSLIKKYIPYM